MGNARKRWRAKAGDGEPVLHAGSFLLGGYWPSNSVEKTRGCTFWLICTGNVFTIKWRRSLFRRFQCDWKIFKQKGKGMNTRYLFLAVGVNLVIATGAYAEEKTKAIAPVCGEQKAVCQPDDKYPLVCPPNWGVCRVAGQYHCWPYNQPCPDN